MPGIGSDTAAPKVHSLPARPVMAAMASGLARNRTIETVLPRSKLVGRTMIMAIILSSCSVYSSQIAVLTARIRIPLITTRMTTRTVIATGIVKLLTGLTRTGYNCNKSSQSDPSNNSNTCAHKNNE